MAQIDPSDEIGATRRALHEAFDWARASGYRPGSPEMQHLEQAERNYRRAQRGLQHRFSDVDLDQAIDPPGRSPVPPPPSLEAGEGGTPAPEVL